MKRRALFYLCTALPLLLLGTLVYLYGVDVPVNDQWSLVEDLAKFYSGDWTFDDLRRSHGGHRLLVPRLVLVPLAHWTALNTRVEMALSIVLAAGVFLTLALAARELGHATGDADRSWIVPLIAVAVFSPSQWENWLMGLQMHFFLAILCAVAGFRLLAPPGLSWARFLGAVVLGLVANLTQGSGLVYWLVGAPLVWVNRREGMKGLLQLSVWVSVAVVVIALYLQHYPGDSRLGPYPSFAFEHPLRLVYFILALLGAPLASFTGTAWPRDLVAAASAGSVGLILYCGTTWFLLRRRLVDLRALLYPLSCGLFALGVAVQIGLSRASFGLAPAMASRYLTVTAIFWVGLVMLLDQASQPLSSSDVRGAAMQRLQRFSILVIAGSMIAGSLQSISVFRARYHHLMPARAELMRAEDDDLLRHLHPEVHHVHNGMGILRQRRLSVFREMDELVAPPAQLKKLKSSGQIISVKSSLGEIAAGGEGVLQVSVTNPTMEPWPSAGDELGHHAVKLSYHWFHADGKMAVFNGRRSLLPRDVGPGETMEIEAGIEAPELPGRYLLRLTMLQEGVKWFDHENGMPTDLRVVVRPSFGR